MKPRLRFSLLNLLLFTAILALSTTVVLLWREVKPLRDEVRRLRDEVGELNVQDPTKTCAIEVETDNRLVWKWRVWVPEGAGYKVRGHGGPVSKEGYPTDGGTMWIREPGEHVIRYVIQKDPRDGKWKGGLHANSGHVGSDHQEWVDWKSYSSTSGGVGKTTHVFEPDEVIELIRFRASQVNNSSKIEDPAPGFLVWLEPL